MASDRIPTYRIAEESEFPSKIPGGRPAFNRAYVKFWRKRGIAVPRENYNPGPVKHRDGEGHSRWTA